MNVATTINNNIIKIITITHRKRNVDLIHIRIGILRFDILNIYGEIKLQLPLHHYHHYYDVDHSTQWAYPPILSYSESACYNALVGVSMIIDIMIPYDVLIIVIFDIASLFTLPVSLLLRHHCFQYLVLFVQIQQPQRQIDTAIFFKPVYFMIFILNLRLRFDFSEVFRCSVVLR